MATWNHRVVQKRDPYDEVYYEIHEAHYNDAGELCAITESPISPFGEDVNALKWVLEHMLKACETPILVDGEIEFAPWDEDEDN